MEKSTLTMYIRTLLCSVLLLCCWGTLAYSQTGDSTCMGLKAMVEPMPVSSQGKCDGGAIVNVMGGTAPFTYFWNDSATTKDRSNLCSKDYYVEITDELNCTVMAQVFVGVKPPDSTSTPDCSTLKANILSMAVSAQGKCDGKTQVNVSGGYPPFAYFWNDSATIKDRMNLCSGSYYVKVTDSKGCLTNADVYVGVKQDTTTDPCANFYTAIQPQFVSAQGKCDGSIIVEVMGGAAPFSYLWNDSLTVKDRYNLCARGYSIKVKDSKNCIATAETFVGTKPPDSTTVNCSTLAADITSMPVSAQGKCDGKAQVYVTGGYFPYAFMWKDSATTKDRMNLCSGGTYVNITDSKGCKTVADVFIGVKPPDTTNTVDCSTLKASIASMPVSAQGKCDGKAQVSVTGGYFPYAFMWKDSATTRDRMYLCSGGTHVNITDSKGCKTVADVFIGVKSPDTTSTADCSTLKASIAPMPVSVQGKCDGGASVNVTGGAAPYTFMWGDSATTKDRMNLCSRGYYVKVTDSKNCVVNADVFVGIKPTTTGGDTCNGFKAFPTPTPASAQGKCDGSVRIELGGGTAPFKGFWNGTNELVVNGEKSNLCSNPYSVLVKDAKGCAITVKFFIGVKMDSTVSSTNPCLDLRASMMIKPVTGTNCDGAASIMPAGGTTPYAYAWIDSSKVKERTGLCSGTYAAKVIDAKGCVFYTKGFVGVKLDTVTGTPCKDFRAIVHTAPVSTNGKCDGGVKVEVIGGVAPFNVMWSDMLPLKERDAVCAGTYNVEVKDAKGCITKASGVVGISSTNTCAGFSAVITATDKTSKCDGYAYVTVTGGTAPFAYGWSNYFIGPKVSNLCPGVHYVRVKDSKGCVAEAKARIAYDSTITAPTTPPLAIRVKVQAATSVSNCDGYASVYAFGGVPPYTIKYSNGVATNENYPLCAGAYSVLVYDSKGSFDSLKFVIAAPEKQFVFVKPVLKDSVILATNFANAINECSITFSNIDSIRIKNYVLASNKDSVKVNWLIYLKGQSPKDASRTYPIGQIGVYKFVLDLYCGGGATFKTSGSVEDYAQGEETIKVEENVITSVIAMDKTVSFIMYPNPVTSTLNISAEVNNYAVEVMDVLGKTMISGTSDSNNYTLNMEQLPHGLYFVRIQSGSFNKVMKLVKQ